MDIRVMTSQDYDAVYALWMRSKNMGFNNLDDSREGVDRLLRRNPNTSFVAMDGEKLTGVILSGQDGRRGYIYHMCVAEAYRRQGIGSKLVERCLTALKAEGINKVALLVFNRNEAGNAFWTGIGWKKSDVNYYTFTLNEENITHFIGEEA
jgi:ribosomal protein S18 acetylase RimI-like enzyme